jgi:hypothetical protein
VASRSSHRPARVAALRSVLVCLMSAWPPALGAQTLTIVAEPRLSWAADRIRAVNLEQLAAALARAGLDPPPEITVTLVGTEEERARTVPEWVAGFAVPPRDIVNFPERASGYPYDSTETVVAHEIAHLALDARAGGRALPRWFHEGVAVSIEAGWGLADQARLLAAVVSAPEIEDVRRLFASGTRPDSTAAYLLATALVDDISRRHGSGTIGAVASRVAQNVPFDRAFTEVTGESVEVATALAWEPYRRWTRWVAFALDPASIWTLILALAAVAFVARRRRRARRRRQWDDEEVSAS